MMRMEILQLFRGSSGAYCRSNTSPAENAAAAAERGLAIGYQEGGPTTTHWIEHGVVLVAKPGSSAVHQSLVL